MTPLARHALTAEEQALIKAWYLNFSGASEEPEELPVPEEGPGDNAGDLPDADPAQEQAKFADVTPIFQKSCSGFFCHGGGFASGNSAAAYDAVVNKNLCAPILKEVQSGAMPAGKGCSGDPVKDAGIAGCLTQSEYDLLVSWVTGDEACPQ